jgi:hypothetical protein
VYDLPKQGHQPTLACKEPYIAPCEDDPPQNPAVANFCPLPHRPHPTAPWDRQYICQHAAQGPLTSTSQFSLCASTSQKLGPVFTPADYTGLHQLVCAGVLQDAPAMSYTGWCGPGNGVVPAMVWSRQWSATIAYARNSTSISHAAHLNACQPCGLAGFQLCLMWCAAAVAAAAGAPAACVVCACRPPCRPYFTSFC